MRKVKKGATLLEVVIALAILGIMIMPLMNSLLTAVRANKKGEDSQDAKLIGQQVVEKLRLEEEIKKGNINIGEFDIAVSELRGSTGNHYYDLVSNEVDGYKVIGQIQEKGVSKINNGADVDAYINRPLSNLLVVDGDSLYYAKSQYSGMSIKDIYAEESKSDAGKHFIKRSKSISEPVLIDIKNLAPAELKQTEIILDGGSNIYTGLGESLGIYVLEKNSFNFKMTNTSAVTQDIIIFKDSDLSKEDGTLQNQIKQQGTFNNYTNVIFNSKDKSIGLYTADIKIEKDGDVVEETQSQFYLD